MRVKAEHVTLRDAKLIGGNYLVVLDGTTLPVTELTHAQTMVALCNAIEMAEAASSRLEAAAVAIGDWARHGRISKEMRDE